MTTKNNYLNMNKELLETVQKLSQVDGFKNVCNDHGQNDAMPSTSVMKEIVQLSRSILFPGYFGDSAVNNHTMLYHIGVNVDRLQMLLAQQIRAGMCFNSRTESIECLHNHHYLIVVVFYK